MDNTEARAVLSKELAKYRAKTYGQLVEQLLGKAQTYEVPAQSGVTYQVEVQAFWDDKTNAILRVSGAIDDRGIRAYMPLTEDFLVSPSGEFVDE